MTYEEIKKKYEKAVFYKKASINAAKSRIEFLKQLRQNLINEREEFRSDGNPNYQKSNQWTKYTRQISRMDDKIRAAEIDLGTAYLGEDGVKELCKKLEI